MYMWNLKTKQKKKELTGLIDTERLVIVRGRQKGYKSVGQKVQTCSYKIKS